jgi:hypothetical protein
MATARRPCHAPNKFKQIFLFIVFNYEISTKNSELKIVPPDLSPDLSDFAHLRR